jgi:transposase InsO family protein
MLTDDLRLHVPESKTALAARICLSRSMLYYRPKMPERDWNLKIRIENILHSNPSYGHKRIARALSVNKKPVLRVMHLFGIKPMRRRTHKPTKAKDLGKNAAHYQNLLLTIPFPTHAGIAWVSDFTYIKFHEKFVYLATIMDLYHRQVVGWSVLTSHTAQLTVTALIDALEKHDAPDIIHSDQGSEYRSKIYTRFVEQCSIQVSMSRKGSPWENGYQESFYSQFKVDLGDPNRFKNLAELAVALHQQIFYYNNSRIHSKLRMSPVAYAEQLLLLQTN